MQLNTSSSIINPQSIHIKTIIYLLNLAQLEREIDVLCGIIYIRISNAGPSLTTVQFSAIRLNLLGAFSRKWKNCHPPWLGDEENFVILSL